MLEPTIDCLHGQIFAMLSFQSSLLDVLPAEQRAILTDAFMSSVEARRKNLTAIKNSDATVSAFDNTAAALLALI
ncbi:hypothetical protein [Paraburkholderia sp. RL17-337-BIB-A]|uniref:hypothetical protein n=1 Tax=Paraburkholderia sp. RL17-337-BIB-A TaxID=3031636 RepID=UPI0038BBAA24